MFQSQIHLHQDNLSETLSDEFKDDSEINQIILKSKAIKLSVDSGDN